MSPLWVFLLAAVGLMVAELALPVHGGFSLLLVLAGLLWWAPLPLAFGPSAWILLGALALVWLLAVVVVALYGRRRPRRMGGADMVGATGAVRVAHPLRIQVRGENWQARSATPLSVGAEVQVVGMHGLTLEVIPAAARSVVPPPNSGTSTL